MQAADWPRLEAIYAAGIRSGQATFETSAPTWDEFDREHLAEHRFVVTERQQGPIVGWIAGSPTSHRAVYAGVVEHSVYVDPAAAGRGVGRALLDAYIASTEAAGIWTLQAGLFPENIASLSLHSGAGFRVVGTRERIGRMGGVWRDVVLVERRSALV
jgi:L-amino acid N-acyltransferase YncA